MIVTLIGYATTVHIVVYSSDGRAAAATLSPVAAIWLAGQLLAVGVRRL